MPLKSEVASSVPEGLNATPATPELFGSVRVAISFLVVTFHR